MRCCYIYSQENDEAAQSSVQTRANKHTRKRNPAKQLQITEPKRAKYGSGKEVNGRFYKNKTTSSDITSKCSSISMQSFESGEIDMTDEICDKHKKKKSEFIDKPSHSILPNWDKLFDDENPLIYGNEIKQLCLRSSESSPTICAFNPKQVDDISDLIEEAKPTINILPTASTPVSVPDQSFHNIFPNRDYLLRERNPSFNEDEIQQQCLRRAACSPPVSAFDPIRIIDFSDINEQTETNMNILVNATPSLFFPDQPTDITLPNWDYLLDDRNPSSYGDEIQQQCRISPDCSYNITAVNPMETVDFSDTNEQAYPNINIVPDIPPPLVSPAQSTYSIFPNWKYSSYGYSVEQLKIMATLTSLCSSDPMKIVDTSKIKEQAKPNIKKFPDAPPPPILPI